LASKIKNVVETTFTSKGAARVEKETQSIGRAQTRLGQESASAGRQFAAQATGLGGIVAAYAGAAATVFALSSAFGALAQSARAAQAISSLNILAAQTGASGKALAASIQEVLKGQLTLLQTTEKLSISLASGFSTDQIEGLAEVALRSSRALGRDLNDSFNRVVKGAAELNSGILKQLGIFVRVDTAVASYAAAVGKSASELSEYERRQALVNAVIDEGNRKFSGINTTIPTTLEKIDSFTVKVRDLAIQFGIFIADSLAPLAAILTDSVGGAFAAVGLTISLVASKGIQVLTAGTASLTASITNTGISTENFVRGLTKTGTTALQASSAITTLDASILKLNKSQSVQLTTLQDAASSRALSSNEIKTSINLINTSTKALQAERQALIANTQADRDRFRGLLSQLRAAQDTEQRARAIDVRGLTVRTGAKDPAFIERTKQIRAAQREQKNLRAEIEQLRPVVQKNTQDIRENSVALAQNRVTIQSLTPALQGFAAGFSGFAVTVTSTTAAFVSGFTGLATSLLSLGSRIFFAINLITLLGTSIAGVLGRAREFDALISNLGKVVSSLFTSQTSRNVKEVLQGISAVSLEELEKVDSTLKDIEEFTFRTKFVGIDIEVTKTKQDLINEVNDLLLDATTDIERSLGDRAISGLVGAATGRGLARALATAIPRLAGLGGPLGLAIGTAAGAGIGLAFDAFFIDKEFKIPPAVEQQIRSQFAGALQGVDEEVQQRLVQTIAQLRDRLGDAAVLDPSARAALSFQEQLVIASAKYLENIEAVSDIVAATAQPVDTIVRNFQFERAKNDVNDVLKTLTQIQGLRFDFEFITDAQREELRKVIQTPEVPISTVITDTPRAFQNVVKSYQSILPVLGDLANRGETLKNVLDRVSETSIDENLRGEFLLLKEAIEGTPALVNTLEDAFKKLTPLDVTKPFLDLEQALQNYQQNALRAIEVGRALSDGIDAGVVDVESFTQGFANLTNSIVLSERSLSTINNLVESIDKDIASIALTDQVRAAALTAQRDALVANRDNIQAQLITSRELLKVLEAQGEQLKAQERLTKFLSSFTIADFDPIKIAFDLPLAGLSEAEKFLGTIELLSTKISESTEDQVKTFNQVNAALGRLNLTASEVQLIISSAGENLDSLASTLDAREGITAFLREGNLILQTIDAAGRITREVLSKSELQAAATADTTRKATEALQNFVKQNIQQLPQVVDTALNNFKKLVEDIDKELARLTLQEKAITFKAQLDDLDFQNQLAVLQSRFELDRLQLQVDLVAAQVSVGDISAREGAEQENQLQQDILTERRNLINLEFQQQKDSITRRAEEAVLEYDRSLDVIEQESAAQRARVEQELDYIKLLIGTYNDIIVNQNTTNQALLTGLTTTGQALSDALIETFNRGAIALTAAIRAGFDPNVAAIQAEGVTVRATQDLETPLQISLERVTASAEETISRIEQLERRRAELARQTSQVALEAATRELQIAEQTRDNKLALLGIESEIETLKAQERLQKAKGTGDKLNEEADRLKQIYLSVFEGIRSGIETSLIGVKNFILFGEGNLRDVFVNLLRSIADAILEEGFIKPISESITKVLFGALTGIQGGRGGIEELFKRPSGTPAEPIHVTSATIPLLGGPSPTDEAGGLGGFFQGISGSITRLFGGLFGEGGFVVTIIRGFGNIVGNVFGGILRFFSSIFGFASGGSVLQRAAGGAIPQFAAGGMPRDRVPAMLEPGEFVLRRRAVRELGVPVLQQMNATGQAPSGAPIVNIINEGSAKTAEVSQPRFDGERYVIDIITRDLQNNGPIRRTLRSGL
jgi:hypothetical protein